MSISPRSGRDDLESMRDRLDRILNEVGGRTWELLERTMPVDVFESEERVVVTVSVPGVRAEDLDIQFTDGLLTIRATTEQTEESDSGTWHIRERRAGVNERSVPVPRSADVDRADASLDNGVLTIKFPVVESATRRRISIRSGDSQLESP